MIAGFSTTTLLVLTTRLLVRFGLPDFMSRGQRRVLCWSVVLASLFLYPMSLGLGPYDPYALGFSGVAVLLFVLACLAVVAFVSRTPYLLGSILAAVVAFGLDLGASQNLWDYLLDPWLFVYASYQLVRERFTIV